MNNGLRHIVYLSVWTFTVIFVWVCLSIYFKSNETHASAEVTEAVAPLPATFDREALEGLQNRINVPVDLSVPGVSFEEESASSGGAPLTSEIIASP